MEDRHHGPRSTHNEAKSSSCEPVHKHAHHRHRHHHHRSSKHTTSCRKRHHRGDDHKHHHRHDSLNNNNNKKLSEKDLPDIVAVKRRKTETERLEEVIISDSEEGYSGKNMFNIKNRFNFIGNTPFTRKQKDQIYKIMGAPKPVVKPKKLNYTFDPTIFDNEKSSDSEDDLQKRELKCRSDVIVGEFLIPLKECVEQLDKMVRDSDTSDEDELPDLEIIEPIRELDQKKVATVPCRDLEYLYPGLRLSPDAVHLMKNWQPSVFQPVVQMRKLKCVSPSPISQRKIPRLVLKMDNKQLTHEKVTKSRNIFDNILSMSSEGAENEEDCGNNERSGLTPSCESSDSSDEDSSPFPRKRRGYKRCEPEVLPAVTTAVLFDEYSQAYRYRASKSIDHHWIASQPIAESMLLPECSTTKVIPFFSNMVHIIEGCHDEGADFYLKVLQLVSSFTTSKMEAPLSVLRMVLFDILLTCEDVYKVQMSYNLLVDLLDRHPPRDELPFEWKDLELVVSELNLPQGLSHVENRVAVLRKVLALKYMVCAIEKELLHRTFTQQRQVNKSVAYQWLSCEVAFPHVRSIMRWLVQCLSFGEYDDLQINFFNLCISEPDNSQSVGDPLKQTEDTNNALYIPKVFPVVEKLLDLSLEVSRQPLVCAERMANDLSLEYNHLTNLVHKKFVLENLSHPLLRLKLVSRVLSHCDTVDEVMIRTDVRGLGDIVCGHFLAKPPLNAFTPPTTPGDDKQVTRDMCTQYPVEAVEELAMLLWFAVDSYLQIDKGNFTESISRRALDKKRDVNASSDADVRGEMKTHVERLEKRLAQYCWPETSSNIKLYLMCLSSVHSQA